MIYKFLLNGLMTAVVFVSAFLSFTLDNYVTIFVSLFVLFFWWIPRIRKLIEKDYHGSWKIFLMSYIIKPSNEQLEQLAYDRLGGKVETIPWEIIKEFKKEGRKKAFEGVDWEVIEITENMLSMRVWVEPGRGFIMHYHDIPEIIKVEEGILTMNGMHYPKGSEVKINKGMKHDPRNKQLDKELVLHVEFKNK